MITKTRRRNRRRFQPNFDSLSQRIAPTVFLPSPADEPVGEVSYPDCEDSGETLEFTYSATLEIAQVSYPE